MLFLPDFLSFLILFVLGRTVTLQTAFFPLDVFAVIVAFPTPFSVIFPPEETAATFLLELVHVTVLLEALDGAIDFFNV